MPLCGFLLPVLLPPEKALPLSQAFTLFSADWLGPWAADYLGWFETVLPPCGFPVLVILVSVCPSCSWMA